MKIVLLSNAELMKIMTKAQNFYTNESKQCVPSNGINKNTKAVQKSDSLNLNRKRNKQTKTQSKHTKRIIHRSAVYLLLLSHWTHKLLNWRNTKRLQTAKAINAEEMLKGDIMPDGAIIHPFEHRSKHFF